MGVPVEIIAELQRIAGQWLIEREIEVILETPQPMLQERRPIDAWNAGDEESVRSLIRHVAIHDDDDAPELIPRMASRNGRSSAAAGADQDDGGQAVHACSVCGATPAVATGEVDPDLGEVWLCERHRSSWEGDYT